MTSAIDLFLKHLHRMSPHTYQVMWGLFEKRERASQSEYAISARYGAQRSKDMDINCGKWALEAISVLESLYNEIRLVFSEPTGTWDPNILRETVNLMQFLMNFLGDLKGLKDACHNKRTENFSSTGGIDNYGDIANVLQKKQAKVWNAIIHWLGDNPEFCPILSEDTTISVATFRELIIRNRLHGLQMRLIRGKIFKNMETKLKKEIEKIASDSSTGYPYFPDSRLIHHLEKFLGDKFCEIYEHAWIPRTIVVVYDKRNSLLLTGASQAACDNFVFWKDVTRTIIHLRLGRKFSRIVDQCSESYNRQANLVKRDKMQLITQLNSHFRKLANDELEIQDQDKAQVGPVSRPLNQTAQVSKRSNKKSRVDGPPDENTQVDRIYDEIIMANKPEVEKDFSDVTERSDILCLAVNGYSLTPVPPCLRCERMYPGWNHWITHRAPAKTTQDALEKIEFISKELGSSAVIKSDSDRISYCAESIAAAKIYALRTGKLAIV